MVWEYGKQMVNDGVLLSLDNWSDEKEEVISKMDTILDYLWYEDKKGIHFIDRAYAIGITDNMINKRLETNEIELCFKNISEAHEWLNNKLKKELIMEKNQKLKSIDAILKLRNKIDDFCNWAYDLPPYENSSERTTQAEAILTVLDWVLGNVNEIELNVIDAGDGHCNCIHTWNDFYKIFNKEKQNVEKEED